MLGKYFGILYSSICLFVFQIYCSNDFNTHVFVFGISITYYGVNFGMADF